MTRPAAPSRPRHPRHPQHPRHGPRLPPCRSRAPADRSTPAHPTHRPLVRPAIRTISQKSRYRNAKRPLIRPILDTPLDTNLGKVAVGFGTYLRAPWRRRGLSEALWDTAISFMRAHRVDHILAECAVDNQASQGLARKLGINFERQVGWLRLEDY